MNDFVTRYGGIYEHSEWVAEQSAPIVGDVRDIDTIAAVMADCVDNAAEECRPALTKSLGWLPGR